MKMSKSEKSVKGLGREESKRPSELGEVLDGASEISVHLHANTFLAVFAVLLIYFAQLVSLVGAGSVCLFTKGIQGKREGG